MPYLIYGYVGAAILLAMLSWLAIAFYLAKIRACELANYFSNSPLIKSIVPRRQDGFSLHLRYIGILGACVTFPSGHLNRGDISAEDLHNLPTPVRRLLKALHCSGLGLVASLILTYFVGKYGFDL